MRTNLLRYLSWLLVLVYGLPALGEGTKQLQPTADKPCKIDILNPNATKFASYQAGPNERLQIHIKNPQNEKIYFGFGVRFTGNEVPQGNPVPSASNIPVYYRIKDPAGNIVAGPTLLTDSGPGFIATYNQAVAGPSAIAGSQGYNALSYQPTVAGDYYIEFNAYSPTVFNNANFKFNFFDISVVNTTSNQAILGRLWSKTWDLSTLDFQNQLYTKVFVYTPDGVVTSIDYNGMQPFGYTVVANSTGLVDSGNGVTDRKSSNEKRLYPEYPIFLNDPDPSVYPSGSPATITANPTITRSADDGFCINVNVSDDTAVEIILNLNGQPGYQPGTADILMITSLTTGQNCLPWNGKNGLGSRLAPGTEISGTVKTLRGLVNLPMYDVENNVNGLIIKLQRPLDGKGVKVYHDDTNVTIKDIQGNVLVGGSSNLSGCTNPTGCHSWTKNFPADNTATQSDGQPLQGFGDEKTLNTWWYTEEVEVPFTAVLPIVPQIGIAKASSKPVLQPDGSYNVTFKIYVQNMGNVDLNNVQVTDNLTAAFPPPATVKMVTTPTATGTLVANTNYNGTTNTDLLTIGSTLVVGATHIIEFTINITPNGSFGPFYNTAIGTGKGPNGTPTTDTSTNGTDPDPDGDGNPDEPRENIPTPVALPPNPIIGVAKAVANVMQLQDRTFDVTYTIVVKNLGNAPLSNVQVVDTLLNTFSAPVTFNLKGSVTATGTLVANSAFNGQTNAELLVAANSFLAVGETASITFTINVDLSGTTQTVFYNTAFARGTGPGNTPTKDTSTDGTNPDPDGDGKPDEPEENEPTPVTLDPIIIPEGYSPNGDDIHDTYVIRGVTNLKVDMEIFNRWGNLVYQKKDYKNDWDGRSNAGLRINDELPDGTYYYIIKLSDNRKFVGYLTLAR